MSFRSWFRNRYYKYELRTSSVPTLSSRHLVSDILVVLLGGLLFFCLTFYYYFSPGAILKENAIIHGPAVTDSEIPLGPETSKSISFSNNGELAEARYPNSSSLTLRSSGSLVKVRLQNEVETYQRVPVFAQVTDYGLGKNFVGKIIIGDATPMPDVGRIRIDFHTVRVNGSVSMPIAAQALALDGSFGIPAHKKENIIDRTMIGSFRSGISNPINQGKLPGGFGLEGFLVGAILRGLQTELQSDVSTDYNKATVFTLRSGNRFLVQLVDDFGIYTGVYSKEFGPYEQDYYRDYYEDYNRDRRFSRRGYGRDYYDR